LPYSNYKYQAFPEEQLVIKEEKPPIVFDQAYDIDEVVEE
jgi:hypothetical protein